jgi:thiamine biosynthesis lipoprotein
MRALILLLFPFLFFSACQSQKKPTLIVNEGYAQGSTYHIKYLSNNHKDFGADIEQIFKDIDHSMSFYIRGSLITQLNNGNSPVTVDSMFMTVLNRSIEIAEETSGDFDPTVGPLARLWGFGYDTVRGDLSADSIEAVKAHTGYKAIHIDGMKISIPKNYTLDFNAIAQGYTVDYIANYLHKKGIQNYMIEVGGEVRTRGVNEAGEVWRIGVDKPSKDIDSADRFQFIVQLKNSGLATSGNYRKFWVDEETGVRYSHTINPHTGYPAENRLLSASLIAPTAMDADAYATVCMVRGLEGCKEILSQHDELEGYLIFDTDGKEWGTYITKGFENIIVD